MARCPLGLVPGWGQPVPVVAIALWVALVPTYRADSTPDNAQEPVLDRIRVRARDLVVIGPGLNPQSAVLPCRYFTIQLRDPPFTEGSTDGDGLVRRDRLRVNISGSLWDQPTRNSPIQVRAHVLSVPESQSWIVRYKLYSTMRDMRIQVDYESEPVPGFPRVIPGPIQPSHCACPTVNLTAWLARQSCPVPDQIRNDLALFPRINMAKALFEARRRFHNPHAQSFCHYAVRDSEIYRQCYGEHVGFHMFPDAFLTYFTSVARLPDFEFLINLGDWPLSRLGAASSPLPIVSWCKTPDFADILLPTYEITEASLECMGRQMLDMLSLQENSHVPWSQKIPRAFFRGRDSRKERLDLIRLAVNHSDIMDVGITRYFFFRDQETVLGTKESVSMFDFFKFKYQISLDGTVAAYRLPYLLAGGSLVFKQDSDYVEHFYKDLKPWIHYVPIRSDLSDLVDQIRWAQNHDEEAHAIALNGRRFAQEHLLPQHVLCYHGSLFQEIAQRLDHKPTILEGMQKVDKGKTTTGQTGNCHCPSNLNRDEL